MHDDALGGGATLGLVGIQQRGFDAPVEHGGQLPAQVHRVLQTQVEAWATHRRVDVGSVADQEHPTLPVPGGNPGVDAGEPAQIQWRVG